MNVYINAKRKIKRRFKLNKKFNFTTVVRRNGTMTDQSLIGMNLTAMYIWRILCKNGIVVNVIDLALHA